jgi:SAM-dependent methyltransferase
MWDERYATSEYIFGRQPNAFLASRRADLPATGQVLALADGEGRNGVWLASLGLDVTAVDSSSVALDKARRLAADKAVAPTFVQADLLSFDLGQDRWDAIVAVFIQFLGSQDRRVLHQRIVRALKPGGVLILQGYTPDQIPLGTGGPPDADRLYTARQLHDEFQGLTVRHERELVVPLDEGKAHAGPSAVVEFVAVKPGG